MYLLGVGTYFHIHRNVPTPIYHDGFTAKRLPMKYITAWRGLTALGNKLELWPSANWGP